MKRKIGWAAGIVIVIIAIAAFILLRAPQERVIAAGITGNSEHGAYLARAGDCMACHTAANGKPFAGGLPMSSPLGVIYSTNITPDKETGIGEYSLQDFQRAVRQGFARSGHALYPAMPFPSFSILTDQDVADLYAYFMKDVTPVAHANQAVGITWPLSMRWPLTAWNNLFVDQHTYVADSAQNEQWNRGAYLVQGLGHCGTCHTPRGMALQEKGLDQRSADFLKGATLAGWYAPALNGQSAEIVRNWSVRDLAYFLRTGRSMHSAAFGPMKEVVSESMQYLHNEDLAAIATYIGSLNPDMPQEFAAGRSSETSIAPAAVALRSGDDSARGAAYYVDSCAACHRTDGFGYSKTFPTLAGNSAVLSKDAGSLIRLVLHGSAMPSTHEAPTPFTMPDFAWRMNDEEIATLLTFIRQSWGNQAAAVSAAQVAKIRAENNTNTEQTTQ